MNYTSNLHMKLPSYSDPVDVQDLNGNFNIIDNFAAQVPAVPGDIGASPAIRSGTITLSTTWSGNGPYTQTVTITGVTVTNKSKVDLQPDATVIQQLLFDGVTALYISNNNGVLTANILGSETTASLTIQCTVTEINT